MKNIKPFFLAAKSKKAQHTLKVLSQKYNNYNLKESNIELDRKTLSLLAFNDFNAFEKVVEESKSNTD